MSVGHEHQGPIHADREAELHRLLDDTAFADAVAAYKQESDEYDLPYGGGSDISGKVVFWDRSLVKAIEAGKFLIAGKSEDPRPAGKVHESIEGASIRILGRPYTPSHDLADIAEPRG